MKKKKKEKEEIVGIDDNIRSDVLNRILNAHLPPASVVGILKHFQDRSVSWVWLPSN